MKRAMNFSIVFKIGYGNAYLTRVTDCRGNVSFIREKDTQFGSHFFKDADGFKRSIERYITKYGEPTKVILGGADIKGYEAENLCHFIMEEIL